MPEQAKSLLQNLHSNGITMPTSEFNDGLTQVGAMVNPEHQQDFAQFAGQMKMARAQKLDQMITQQGSQMPQDQFVSTLGNLSSAAVDLGQSPQKARATASQIYNQRVSSGDKGGFASQLGHGVIQPFQQFGLTTAGAALSVTGEVADSLGGFLSKYFPKTGQTIQGFGQKLEGGVQDAITNGVSTSMSGTGNNVTPWGSSASVLSQAGVISPQEAVARGATEALGGTAQIAAMINPELGLAGSAAAFGAGVAAEGVGKGEAGSQAAGEGILAGGTALAFGLGAHVFMGAAGGILNKLIRTNVGRTLLTAVGGLSKNMDEAMNSSVDPEVVKSFLDENTQKVHIAKAGLNGEVSDLMEKPEADYFNNLTDDIRGGSTDAYNTRRGLYQKVFNKQISLASDDLQGTSDIIQQEAGNVGLKKGEDLVGKYSQARAQAAQTLDDPKLIEKATAQLSGLSPEEISAVQSQLDKAPEDATSRQGFAQWVTKLQNLVSRPQGATTEALQSYLNPPQFKGQYDALATRISNGLRDDLESKFDNLGLYDTYKAADSASKKIGETVDTNIRSSAFGASDQSEFERQVVSGEVKPNEPAIKGMTSMLQPDTKAAMQNGLVNELKRQVDEAIASASSSGDPEGGYKEGAALIDKYVKSYGGTDFLSNTDRTNLSVWSSLLKNDFTKNFTAAIPSQTTLGEGAQGALKEANVAGKGASATEGMSQQVSMGNISNVPKEYFKLSDEEKSTVWSSMKTPEAKQTLGSMILNNEIGNAFTEFKDAPNTTREEVETGLKGIAKSFKSIQADTALWENGLTPEQRTVMVDAVNAEEGLSTLQGNKYREAAIKIAKAPIIAALGHPLGSLSNLIGGVDRVIESMFANMQDITPTQMKLYDNIMSSAGKDSSIYQAFRFSQQVLKNPSIGKVISKSATIQTKALNK